MANDYYYEGGGSDAVAVARGAGKSVERDRTAPLAVGVSDEGPVVPLADAGPLPVSVRDRRGAMKITELYAFVGSEAKTPEDEGVMAIRLQSGEWLPLVGADLTRVRTLRPVADAIVERTKGKYRVLRFQLAGEVPDGG